MAYQKPRAKPEFSDLIITLAQSKDTDNALYQTIQEVVNRLDQFVKVDFRETADLASSVGPPELHAPTHEPEGTDPITALDGAVITTGTIADARLSSNVALENIVNTFLQDQFITGNLKTTGVITERNRSNPIGKKLPWTPTASTNEGAGIGGTINASYTLIGEMLFWSVICTNFTIGTATSLVRLTIPPVSPVVAAAEQASVRLFVPGVGDTWGYAVARASFIEFLRGSPGNWPTGTGHVIGQGFYYI